MTYLDYMTYIKFACDEELERMREFMWGIEHNEDQTGDKYYVAYPTSNCPPDFEDVQKALAGRDMAADFALINSDDSAEQIQAAATGSLTEKEELYQEIRELIL